MGILQTPLISNDPQIANHGGSMQRTSWIAALLLLCAQLHAEENASQPGVGAIQAQESDKPPIENSVPMETPRLFEVKLGVLLWMQEGQFDMTGGPRGSANIWNLNHPVDGAMNGLSVEIISPHK